MKAWAAGFSSRGSRPYNEDTIFYKNTESGFLAVAADGLGGHGGGAEASALAVQVFSEGFVKSPLISLSACIQQLSVPAESR